MRSCTHVLDPSSAAATSSDTLGLDSLPSPWYFDHEMALDMLGIGLVPLPCHPDPKEGGYVPKVEEAEALITPRTRAIILVTPNNRECPFGRDRSEAHFDGWSCVPCAPKRPALATRLAWSARSTISATPAASH